MVLGAYDGSSMMILDDGGSTMVDVLRASSSRMVMVMVMVMEMEMEMEMAEP